MRTKPCFKKERDSQYKKGEWQQEKRHAKIRTAEHTTISEQAIVQKKFM